MTLIARTVKFWFFFIFTAFGGKVDLRCGEA